MSVRRNVARLLAAVLILGLAVTGLTFSAAQASADDRGPITPGAATTVSIEEGGSASYTFSTVANRHLTLTTSGSTWDTGLRAEFARPDGAVVTAGNVGGVWGPFGDTPLITQSGTWTLTLTPNSSEAGSVVLTLGLVADQTGRINTGASVTRSFSTPGQNARLTFRATAGQRLAFRVTSLSVRVPADSLATPSVNFRLTAPGSSTPGYVDAASAAPSFFQSEALPSTGRYTLTVDPAYGTTGTITFTVYAVTDVTASLTPDTPASVAFQTPGQRATLNFDGIAGARVTVRVTGSESLPASSARLALVGPEGSTAGDPVQQDGYYEWGPLDRAGAWSIVVSPENGATGTLTVTLGLPTDVRQDAALGVPVPLTLVPGQNARFSFPAEKGNRVTLAVADASWQPGPVAYRLVAPEGGTGSVLEPAAGRVAVGAPLDVAGTWTLEVDPELATTGSATLILGIGADRVEPIALDATTPLELAPGDTIEYTFDGRAGLRPNFSVTAADWRSGRLGGDPGTGSQQTVLVGPDGTEHPELLRDSGTGVRYLEGTAPLPESGTWKLRIVPAGDSYGTQTLVLRQPADATGTILSGTSSDLSIRTPGQRGVYTFTAAAGQRAVIDVTGQTWTSAVAGGDAGSGSATLTFLRPDGAVFGATRDLGRAGRQLVETEALDVAGTWTVVLDPGSDAVGSLTVLPRLMQDTKGGNVASGITKTVSWSTPGERTRYSFVAAQGDSVALELLSPALTADSGETGVVARLIPPAGSTAKPRTLQVDPAAQSETWLALAAGDGPIDASGTWTLELDPQNYTVGSTNFALHVRTPATGELVPGTAKNIRLTSKGQDAVLALTTKPGTAYTWSVTGSTFAAATFGRESSPGVVPDRQPVPRGASSGSLGVGDGGVWSLRLDPTGPATGALMIAITEVSVG